MKLLGYFLALAGLCAAIFFFYRAEQAHRAGLTEMGLQTSSDPARRSTSALDNLGREHMAESRDAMTNLYLYGASGLIAGLVLIITGTISERRARAARERRRWGQE